MAGPFTPTIPAYTDGSPVQSTDEFIIERPGTGTMRVSGLMGNGTAGNLTVTDLTNTVTQVGNITFVGAVVSPTSGTGTATVTISFGPAIAFRFTTGD